MTEKTYETASGIIHYWTNKIDIDAVTLVFLPGLTADHRLFEKQIEYFKDKYNVFVWDPPAHASSWPFNFDFNLMDKAKWLNEILEHEKITCPVIVGQSMGGYVGQTFAELYPEKLKGFISIDSAPLQRKYGVLIDFGRTIGRCVPTGVFPATSVPNPVLCKFL
jgi:pimeloyl-ACP methyl ester carboxylesterase